MVIEFHVNGLFEMTILDIETNKEVDKSTDDVLAKLQDSTYVIGINSKLIFDLNDLETPLYKFELEPTDAVDYMFDCATEL